jgi:hypothetical protein
MKKLTQKPPSPSRAWAKRVFEPSASRTRRDTRSSSGSSGSGSSFSLEVDGNTRRPSVSFSSISSWRRRKGSAFTSAARVRLTVLMVCWASSRERGSRS